MSKRPMTDQEFLEKLSWEEPYYAFTEYGLSEENLDPDSELWPIVAMCSVAANTLESALKSLQKKAFDMGLDAEW